MASRPKGGLGHADHRDAELSLSVRTKAGPATAVKVGVAVDHQEAQTAQPAQDRADRREFTQIELTSRYGSTSATSSVCSATTSQKRASAATTAAALAPPEPR